MNRNLLIALFGIIVVVALGIAFFFLRAKPAPANPQSPSFPIGQGVSPGTTGTSTELTIATQDPNAPLPVNDFIDNGTTILDPSNPGSYYLTGTDSGEFAIKFDSAKQFFTIALDREPLGQTRQDAEQFLERSLGVSAPQLCSLQYYIGTDEYTNAVYAGKNLGFSFCPGATKLP